MAANLDPSSPSSSVAALSTIMPVLSISSPATIRRCSDLELRDSDIFICSYPKSGTTWMQHIVLSLLLLVDVNVDVKEEHDSSNANKKARLSFDHVSELAPFFEIDAHWQGDELADWIQVNHRSLGRRVFNTHLRFPMLPTKRRTCCCYDDVVDGAAASTIGGGAKFIYLVRSPLDVCVSFYHHLSNQVEGNYGGSFEQFFDEWLDGALPYGSWVDHVRSYDDAAAVTAAATTTTATSSIPPVPPPTTPSLTLADGRRILFISYEEMLHDLERVVHSIVVFLGLHNVVSAQQRADLLPTFSFAAMKADLDRFQPKSVHWRNDFCFLRKGVVGDHHDTVTEAQRARVRQRLEQSGLLTGTTTYLHQLLRNNNSWTIQRRAEDNLIPMGAAV